MSDYSKELYDFVERSHADSPRSIGMADATIIIAASDEIASLRAQLASAQEVLTDVWFHFSATDDPTLRKIADAARANLPLTDEEGKS